jgi:hypothetical protein
MSYFFAYTAYSIGIFLGIQIGKEKNPNYQYLLNKYSRLNKDYYKNHQMNYRFNR